MSNNNGCTGINCPFQYNKIVQCDLTDCPYRDLPSCFTPANRQWDEEGAIEKTFQAGLLLGLSKACNSFDVVPVVRCKDCVYANEYYSEVPWYPLLCSHEGKNWKVWGKDYCSYGVRRGPQKKDEKKEETT